MARDLLIVIGVCVLTLFVGLGHPPIADSDEGFYAESAREMVESGDWLTPHFNYVYRFEKPILYYWLAALSYIAFGIGEATARLPSALAGLGLSVLTLCVGRRWYNERVGLLAGLVMATSFGHVAMARQALPDLTLAFFITLATWAALETWLSPPHSAPPHTRDRQRVWISIAGGAAGAAVLTKGPVGAALPILVVGPLVGWEYLSGRSPWRVRLQDVGLGALVFLMVVAPWFIEMTNVHGVAYLDRFFVGENIDRFATARYNDPRQWWYYLPIIAGGMLPWSPFMLLWSRSTWDVLRGRGAVDRESIRLIWWTAAPLLFYTASIGKQPRYVLPMLAPLALLIARTIWIHGFKPDERPARGFAPTVWIGGAILVVVGILVFSAQALLLEWPPAVPVALAVSIIGLGLAAMTMGSRPRAAVLLLVAASVVASLGAHTVVMASPGSSAVERMAALIEMHRSTDEPYARHAVFNRNLVFYVRRPFVELPVLRAAEELLREPARILCVLTAEDAERLRQRGVSLRELGEVTYLNTGSLSLRTLLDPSPERLERVVLVTNR